MRIFRNRIFKSRIFRTRIFDLPPNTSLATGPSLVGGGQMWAGNDMRPLRDHEGSVSIVFQENEEAFLVALFGDGF